MLALGILNAIEKGQEKLEQQFERQIKELKENQQKLEQRLEQGIKEIKENQLKLEQRFDQEIKIVKDELFGVKNELQAEIKSARTNFVILEFTAIFGFIATLAAIVGPYLIALFKH